MDLAAALRAGPALLRRRPAGVLPYYLLVASAPTVARVPFVLGAGAAVAWLAATGRLDPVVAGVRGLDLDVGPGTGTPAGTGELPAGLADALSGLVTPTTVALVGTGLVATIGCLLVVRAVTVAGALSAVERALAGEEPLRAGARGMARHWRAFLWLAVARAGVRVAALVAGSLAVGVAAAGVSAGGAVAAVAVLVGVAAGGVTLVGYVAAELGLAFAGAAVVVDDVGAGGALRRGFGVAVDRPGAVLLYLVVAAATVAGVGGAGVVLAVAGAARLVALATALVAVPALDGIRVALYAERGPDALPAPDASVRRRATTALRGGLRELRRFLRVHPVANAAGAGVLAVGAVLGWLLVAPYRLGLSPPGDVGGVFGAVPVAPFLNIAANNWLIAAGTGYGGLALGVPAATALLLNGALVGAVAAAFEPAAFVALVGPHGVVELPAIAVAGGLGLHLGRVGWGALRGRRSADEVGRALGVALRVLVGLAAVLVLASAVETVVTPRVAAAVLG